MSFTRTLIFTVLVISGCAGPFNGVYRAPDSTVHLMTCEWKEYPNGNILAYCEEDDRGVW